MTLRNAGILRKIPDDDDLYLTVDGSRLTINGNRIPRLLEGESMKLKPAGEIRLKKRYGYDDLIEITHLNLRYAVTRADFCDVWGGKPYCPVYERVPDCWQGFPGVTA